jgi:hypothetical protein
MPNSGALTMSQQVVQHSLGSCVASEYRHSASSQRMSQSVPTVGCSVHRLAAFKAQFFAACAPTLDLDLDPIPSAIAMALAIPAATRQLLRPHASWQSKERLIFPEPVTEHPKDAMVPHLVDSVFEIIVVRICGSYLVWVSTSRSRRHGHRHESEKFLDATGLVSFEDS